MYQIIFHLDDNDPYRANLTLNNLENVKKDLQNVELELVVYGMGISLFIQRDNPYRDRLSAIQKQGAVLAACNNTVQGMNLTKEDLIPGVIIVPSGVGELVKKQSDGWIYIRP